MPISRRRLEREIDSYRTLSVVVALVKHGKLGKVDADRLRRAVELRGKAFICAYPDSPCTLHKAHWLYHLPLQLARDGFLVDCFVGERNNSVVKQTALSIDNTVSFEASVGMRMITRTCALLEDPVFFVHDRLLKPKPSMDLGFVASAMVCGGWLYAAGDIIVIDDAFFFVVALAQVAGDLHFVASSLEVVEQITACGSRCRKSATLRCFPSGTLEARYAAAWYWVDADNAVVLAM